MPVAMPVQHKLPQFVCEKSPQTVSPSSNTPPFHYVALGALLLTSIMTSISAISLVGMSNTLTHMDGDLHTLSATLTHMDGDLHHMDGDLHTLSATLTHMDSDLHQVKEVLTSQIDS